MATKKAEAVKTAVRKRTVRAKTTAISESQIAERAYYLYLERGGDELENWLKAERELVTA